MLKNITVTLAQSHGYLNIIWGLGFILSSLLPLTGDPILKNIGLGFGLVALLLVGFTLIFLKKEREDERSIGNTNRAYTMAFLLLMVLGTLYSYLDLRCHFNIAAKPVLDSFMGLGLILSGSFFLYYERKGC